MSDGFQIVDPQGTLLYMNAVARRMVSAGGMNPDEVIGRNLWEVFPLLKEGATGAAFRRTLEERVEAGVENYYEPWKRWYRVCHFPVATRNVGMLIQDVTDRKRAEEGLERHTALLEAVLRQMPEGVVIAEAPTGKLVYVNDQVGHIWRHDFSKAEEIVQFRASRGFHGDGRPYATEEWPLSRAVDRGEEVKGEVIRILRGDGTVGVISVNAMPIQNSRGVVVAAVATYHDVTEEKRAADAVRNVARFPDDNPHPVLRVTFEGQLLYANAASRLLLQKWGCGPAGNVPERLCRSVQRARESKRVIEFEETCGERVYSLLVTPIAGETYVNLYGRDVTESKQAEARVRASEEEYRQLIEHLHTAVVVHEPDTRIRLSNARSAELLGLTREQMQGKAAVDPAWQFVHEDGSPMPVEDYPVTRVIRTTEALVNQVVGVDRGGGKDRVWVLVNAFPTFRKDGALQHVVVTFSDITEQKSFEIKLERLVADRTRELRETNDQLNAFCYSIAHDLKAPLRAQSAFAALLETEYGQVLGEEGCQYTRKISEAVERQSRLVADLLSHMSVSRAELPVSSVDLATLVEQARTDLVMEIQQKQAEVDTGGVKDRVFANSASLHLVVLNLLSNALKFVAAGVRPRVRMWTEMLPEGDQSTAVGGEPSRQTRAARLWIEDNGIGIPAEHQQRIFEVFQRLHTTQVYPGTGMGLAIVKKAVERMGGSVGVESAPGQGSRFWVDLPAAERPPQR